MVQTIGFFVNASYNKVKLQVNIGVRVGVRIYFADFLVKRDQRFCL